MSRRPRKPPSGDYEVGRGRPPEATKFPPGKSGNLKGRPKVSSKSPRSRIAQQMERGILMMVDGKRRRVPVNDFLIAKLAQEGSKGSVPALRELRRIEEACAAIQQRHVEQSADEKPTFVIRGLHDSALEALQILNLATPTENDSVVLPLAIVAPGVQRLGRPLTDKEQRILGEACPDFPDWYARQNRTFLSSAKV